MTTLQATSGPKAAGTRVYPGIVGVAAVIAAAILATAAGAAPPAMMKPGAIGITTSAASRESAITGGVDTVLYNNTGSSSTFYYAGQGGYEALDALHMVRGGSLDLLEFECDSPGSGGPFSATVKIYGNPGGLDLGVSPLIGTYVVSGIPTGRQTVSVPLPDAPVVLKDIWVGVQFSRPDAGLVANSTPLVGTSGDFYLEQGVRYDFGQSPLANFALKLVDIPEFSLGVTTAGSGTVTKFPDQPVYLAGTPVQLTANPDPHWHFVNWSGDASGSTSPLSVVVDGNKTITANFAIDTFELTYAAGPNGTINGATSQTVDYGTDGTTVTAVPDLHYHFVSWSDGVLTAARTEMNVAADIDVTANFAIDTFTLTYTAGSNGTIVGSTPQTVDYGTSGTTVTATPDLHYHFVSWSDGVLTAARTDMNVAADIDVTANFAIDTFTLTYTAGPNGTIDGITPQTVDYGTSGTTVTAMPDANHHFVSWSDGVLTAARTDVNVAADISVTANFAIDTFTLTYTAGANGTIAGITPQTVDYGTNGTTVTATPDLHHYFVSWSDGVLTAARTEMNVAADISVTANFAIDTFTLTYTAGPNGTITGTNPQTVNYGASGTAVTATPNTGYHFATWSDGAPAATRTDASIMANLDVTATFEINIYTLTVNTIGNGAVSVDPSQTLYEHGTIVILTATAAAGSHFVGWSGDLVGPVNPRTVSMDSALTVTATFAPDIIVLFSEGFETGIAGWNGYAGGTLAWTDPGRDASLHAASITGPVGTGEFGINDSPAWVLNTGAASRRFRISAWVRSAAGHGVARIRVREYDPQDDRLQQLYSPTKALSANWQQLVVEIVTIGAGSQFDLQVLDEPSGSRETFIVDDVTVEDLGASPVAGVDDAAVELEFARPKVYPNPARGAATLGLSIAKASRLRVELFDLSGRRVRLVADEADAAAGTRRLALAGDRNEKLGVGVYFYRAEVGGTVHRGRFVILN